MLIKKAMHEIKLAFRANFKPGAILWVLMLIFFAAYATSANFSDWLGKVSALKISIGYPFSFGVYVLFAALMPETLKIIFFQKWKITIQNLYNLIFVGLVFGMMGIITDIFYGYQALWFGEANNLRTLTFKTLVDQGLFGPTANYFLVSIFFLRENGIESGILRKILTAQFALVKVMPVVVAGWCVWIPGVIIVYTMPTALQLPVASLILCFWILIFTFVAEKKPESAQV